MSEAQSGPAGDVTILHNPSCSKSRGALAILRDRPVDVEVVEYLDEPPSRQALETIVAKLIDPVADLVRRSDPRFAALGLDPSAYTDEDEVIELLLAHPELMQRPVVATAERAVIARPSERVAEILS